jgi:hypothetical protein
MKTIIFCATALTMTGATLAAGSDWTALDREVEALSSSLAPQGGGVAIGGYINIFYINSSDIGDVSGFGWDNARIGFSAENSGYGVTIDYQLIDNTLIDAYVTTELGGMNVTAGQFKAPAGASGGRAARDQFYGGMLARSAIGTNFAGRDGGVMLGGGAGNLNWAVAIQNGLDGVFDEYRTTLHADFTVMGSGSGVEGCYGAADGMGLVIGASSTDDGGSTDSATIIDASLTSGTFSLSAEFAETDGAGGSSSGPGGTSGELALPLGESPMAISGTYAIGSDWEIGIRHQDLDLADNSAILSIAANNYVNGHDVKYTIQMDTISADGVDDVSILSIGLQVGF